MSPASRRCAPSTLRVYPFARWLSGGGTHTRIRHGLVGKRPYGGCSPAIAKFLTSSTKRLMPPNWLTANPHQSNLGAIGFVTGDGGAIFANAIQAPSQVLDLWRGHLRSAFVYDGVSVEVETVCHPTTDTIGIRARSSKISAEDPAIEITFPYTSAVWGRDPADWDNADAHASEMMIGSDRTLIERRLDTLAYTCDVNHGSDVSVRQTGPHTILIHSRRKDTIELTVTFSRQPVNITVCFASVKERATAAWEVFWRSGGAVDLSESLDPRWMELERRVILSQYLTACQSTGALPPAETGLTCSSWFGKFHLEMHWWHSVHFALWGRIDKMAPMP